MALTQANRALRVQTPLGPDKLLITHLQGTESISKLFLWQLDLLAENATKVEFDKLIGQKIAVELEMPGGKMRYFHGICNRLSEGKRDSTFTHYKMEAVPQFWLLTRRTQCRIFQQIAMLDILKQVLKGFDVKFELKGKYPERDYCVQYRESDFDFASRLMEEEGIYYYFQHDKKGHTLVIADTPEGHADVPESAKAIFDDTAGGNRPDLRVTEWEKVQELRSGKVTLWDNCFELPQQHLDVQKTIQESVAVGKVTHKLKVADNDKLELYDYPGAYAQRFDGVDPGGGDRPGDLKKIFEENARVANLRIQQEATESLEIQGAGNCRQFTAGEKFTLERHFNADGPYVLTSVSHTAKLGTNYRSGEGEQFAYENRFTCIPLALPFRPPLDTVKPTVQGTQTATVVGPEKEIITCDKYGRVKVQFHWDRQGKKDANSSCWVRVSQNWGGAGWGGMFIPHAGQEVIVDFEEGDPDRPLIIGRVYNAETMPPLELPANKTKSAIRDHGGNEIIMEGNHGDQQIKIFSPQYRTVVTMGAPRNPPEGFSVDTDHHAYFIIKQNVNWDVEGNHDEDITKNETITVHGRHHHTTKLDSTERVLIGKELSIGAVYTTTVGGAMNELVVISRTEQTGGFRHELTGAKKVEAVIGPSSLSVGRTYTIGVKGAYNTAVGSSASLAVKDGYEVSAKTVDITGKEMIVLEDGKEISLMCGASSINMKHDGTITINAKNIHINAEQNVEMTSKQDTSIEASGQAEIQASKLLHLEGKPFKLASSGAGDIETSAALTVKGGQVKINC